MAWSPRNVRLVISRCLIAVASEGTSPRANANTRSPCEASSSSCAWMADESSATGWPLSSSARWHRDNRTSTAPFTYTGRTTSPSQSCSVAINWCCDSNGIESSRGQCCWTCHSSNPAFRADTSRAPSVGSPFTSQWPSFCTSVESLHSIPARRHSLAAALSTKASPVSCSILPSVP